MTGSLVLWPLVITIEDVFVPDSAAALVEGLRGVDEQSLATTLEVWAMEAAPQLTMN